MRKTRGAVAFEGTGAVTPGSRSHGSGTSHSYDQDAGPDRGDPPRDLPTARGNSVGLENDRSIAKAFVARRTAAQFVAVQLNQIEGVQEQAAVVVWRWRSRSQVVPQKPNSANAVDTFEGQRIRRASGGRLFRHVERQHPRALPCLARGFDR